MGGSGLSIAPEFAASGFDEASLIAAAEAAVDLHDWGGDPSFRLGMRALISAIAGLNPPPQLLEMARGRILHLLTTRLHFIDDARKNPEITAAPIERPLIVIGLPRTGTTVLYDLLSRDPAARYPRDWEFAMPWPAPEAATFDSDPRIAILNAEFEKLLSLSPELANIQRFGATEASECNFAFTHHFASTNFWAELGVNDYAHWLIKEPVPGRYATHKRVLQQLQWKGPKGRWTIKSPEHLFELDNLLATYPDACLVWTHRDPLVAFSSVSSMISQFWRAAHRPVDPIEMGRMITDIWSTGMERAMKARANSRVDHAVLDIAHQDVVADPVFTVRRIYDHFKLPFSDDYAKALKRFATEERGGDRLGKHGHLPAEFGLTAEGVQARLPTYYKRFGELIARPYPKGFNEKTSIE